MLSRTRLTTPAAVRTMAARNHAPFSSSPRAVSVRLGDAVYFWAAA